MNIHHLDRGNLLAHLRAVEQVFPLRFIGILPRGTAVHISGGAALDLLAEKLPGLSLSSLTGAEIDLANRLNRPVGIVLKSELKGREQEEVLAEAQPV